MHWQVDTFRNDGSWQKPPGAKRVVLVAIGGNGAPAAVTEITQTGFIGSGGGGGGGAGGMGHPMPQGQGVGPAFVGAPGLCVVCSLVDD